MAVCLTVMNFISAEPGSGSKRLCSGGAVHQLCLALESAGSINITMEFIEWLSLPGFTWRVRLSRGQKIPGVIVYMPGGGGGRKKFPLLNGGGMY